MCWSFEVSLGTLIFATLGSLYLFNRNRSNDRFYAYFIFVISLMQGADALAWFSINNSLPNLNKYSSILARILIAAQIPLIYWYLYKTTFDKKYLNVCTNFIGYFIYVAYIIWKDYPKFAITTKNNCNNDCHLEWSWLPPLNKLNYWLVFLLYGSLLLYPLITIEDKRRPIMILIPVLTLLYSLYKYRETKIWGSYWCSAINIWIIAAILI